MKKIKFLASLSVIVLFVATFLSCSMGHDGIDGKDGKDGKDAESLTKPTFDIIVEELSIETVNVRGVKNDMLSDVVPMRYYGHDFSIYASGLKNDVLSNLGSIPLGFRAGMEEIPYIPLADNILKFLMGPDYSISEVDADTTEVTIVNSKTNTKTIVDLLHHEFYFDNYDAFLQKSDVYVDVADVNSTGDYMKITDASNIAGQPFFFDWRNYDIGIVICKDEDEYYLAIPLQTYNDVFGGCFIYNGKNLYPTYQIENFPAVADEYYGTEPVPGVRSEALAEFCYNELCMNLDLNYGLKEIHGISAFPDFDSYFYINGIRDDLKSTDALTFANTLMDLCDFYFGDGHSNYQKNSYYLGKDAVPQGAHTSAMLKHYYENYRKYGLTRNAKIGSNSQDKIDPVPCYTVSADGKTAIVRFDEFTLNDLKKSQITELLSDFDEEKMNSYVSNLEKKYDTVALIHAINEKIQQNSAIENVVLDMSCNGGGACHSAVFLLSWLLGECSIDMANPITGAKWSATYKSDVNFDGTYDDKDTVKDKNLFCLTSPVSFSCGNMVPAVLKASDRATILGVTSGGGASCVHKTCAADGTYFWVSSKNVMSVSKNGSLYNVDTGVEPHYYINRAENFYDTEKISGLVNAINEALLVN